MSEPTGWPVPVAAQIDGPPGAPVVVLGSSLGTSSAVWDRAAPALRPDFRLLRYQLPGHGGAPAWPGPYTIDGLGRGVLALLDSRGIERVGYCGVSLGGMIGMWLAAHAPDRVAALGLVCTAAVLPPDTAWRARADQVRAEGTASIAGAVLARWFTPAFAAQYPAVTAEFAAGLSQADDEGYAGCCEAIAAMDLSSALARIEAPTLVIAGADDPATTPGDGAAIAAAIGGARLQIVPAAAHLAVVSAAGQVGSALRAHLIAAVGADRNWRSER